MQDVREYHTDTTVSFVVKLTGSTEEAEKKGLHKTLKLSSNISTSNMTLFDEQSRIQKYETAEALYVAPRFDEFAARLMRMSIT